MYPVDEVERKIRGEWRPSTPMNMVDAEECPVAGSGGSPIGTLSKHKEVLEYQQADKHSKLGDPGDIVGISWPPSFCPHPPEPRTSQGLVVPGRPVWEFGRPGAARLARADEGAAARPAEHPGAPPATSCAATRHSAGVVSAGPGRVPLTRTRPP